MRVLQLILNTFKLKARLIFQIKILKARSKMFQYPIIYQLYNENYQRLRVSLTSTSAR